LSAWSTFLLESQKLGDDWSPSPGPILPSLVRSSATEEIAIVGMQAREARELALAAEAVGLAVRPLALGSPLADAALAAHGPGSIRLPLAIIAGRYSLQRPAFGVVLECIEVLRGTRQTLPASAVVLASPAGPYPGPGAAQGGT
jgi:hypothetical protein